MATEGSEANQAAERQAREQAAADYRAQFDIDDMPPAPIADDEPALPPRRADGTFAPKKVHPALLAATAKDLGIPDEDVAELPTEDLDRLVKYTTRQVLRMQRDRRDDRGAILSATDRNLTNQLPAQPIAPEPPPVEESIFGNTDVDLIDPGIVRAMKKLEEKNKALEAELNGTKGQIGADRQERNVSNISANTEVIDDVFESFGDKLAAVFGKGRIGDGTLDAKSEEGQTRVDILRMLNIDVTKPHNARTLERTIRQRIGKLYGPLMKQPATEANGYTEAARPATPAPRPPQRRAAPTEDEWNEAAVARPTGRQTLPEQPGRRRAEKAVARMLESQRMTETAETNGSADLEDFLE